jgi:hypothetical protein
MREMISKHKEAILLAKDLIAGMQTDIGLWDQYHSAHSDFCAWLRQLEHSRDSLRLSVIPICDIPETLEKLEVSNSTQHFNQKM